VDAYVAYHFSARVKAELEGRGVDSVVVPPYYWGINHETGAFPGSFSVRPSTMKAVLVDLLASLGSWGFRRIFLLNFHGDLQHWAALLEAVREARDTHGAGVRAVLAGSDARDLGLKGDEEHILVWAPLSDEQRLAVRDPEELVDLHAGAKETSFMALNYPELVDLNLAANLAATEVRRQDVETWRRGGAAARGLAPLGYCGDPAGYDAEGFKDLESALIELLSDAIEREVGT